MSSSNARLAQAAQSFAHTVRVPNLRRAQLAFGATWVGEWAVTVAIGILAYRHGGATATGIVAMARMLPAAIVTPAAAAVVDRYRRERVLLAVSLVRSLALGGAALSAALVGAPIPVYVLVAVATVAYILFRPAHSALLPSICTTAIELTSANVVRGSLDSASALLGPLLAGVLVGPVGIGGVLALCAGSALWSGWLIAGVRYEAAPRIDETPPSHVLGGAIDGVRIILSKPDVRLVTALSWVQTFTRGCLAVFSVVIVLQLLRLHASGVGLLTAGFGAGAVVGSLAVSLLVRSSGFGRWLAVGVAGWGIPFIALAATSSELLAIALLAVVGVANAVVDVSYYTLLQWLVPDELMGRVFVSDESLLTASVAAGSLAASGLIAWLGVRGALVAAGLFAPLGALFALSRLRRLDARVRTTGNVVELLQRVVMLAPLPLATITQLAAKAQDQLAGAGELVVQEGTTGDDFYVIRSGRADVLVEDALVGRLGPAECFGEIAALKGTRRTATVRAATALELLRFNGPHFLQAITGYTPSSTAASALVQERVGHAVSSAGGGTEEPSVRD